jgi:hypothetical protein
VTTIDPPIYMSETDLMLLRADADVMGHRPQFEAWWERVQANGTWSLYGATPCRPLNCDPQPEPTPPNRAQRRAEARRRPR